MWHPQWSQDETCGDRNVKITRLIPEHYKYNNEKTFI